jgi:uncharacterized protein (TIRG00374 family)
MSERQAGQSRHLYLFGRIAVVVVGLIAGVIWLSKEQRWQELVGIFRRMSLGIFVVTLAVFTGANLIIALRWWLLLRTQSIYIGFWPAVRLHFLGLFYNNFMPSSVGGDLIRAWYVTKHTEKRFEAALSVLVDRVIGLASTLVIAVFFYLLFLRNQREVVFWGGEGGFLNSWAEYKWYVFWAFLAFTVIFCGLLSVRRGRTLLVKLWLSVRTHGLRLFGKLKNAVVVYFSNPLAILAVFGLTVCLQITTITAFAFLGKDLGITVSIKYYYVFFTLTWVLGAIPVSIGGAVIVEGLLSYMFIHFAGVAEGPAVALALCQRAIWMLTSLPGAGIHLIGAHLPKDLEAPKDFFVDYEKPPD